MAVKASRYLTHIRRLREPAEPVGRLLAALAGLGDRLGPVLLQLPPTLRADAGALDDCLAEFARQAPDAGLGPVRVAVEPRHDSWWTDDIRGPAGPPRGRAVLGRPARPPGHPAVAHRRLGLPALP